MASDPWNLEDRFPPAGTFNAGSFTGLLDPRGLLRRYGQNMVRAPQPEDASPFGGGWGGPALSQQPEQPQPDTPPPLLSPMAYAGGGNPFGPAVQPEPEGFNWGRSLNNVGAWLMANDTGGKSLSALKDGDSDYSLTSGPDGQLFQHNKRTGRVQPVSTPSSQMVEMGEDIFGNKIRALKIGQQFYPVQMSGAAGGQGEGGAQGFGLKQPVDADGAPLGGQELLDYWRKTSPKDAAVVEALLRGDMNLGTRQVQKYAAAAALVDPSYAQYDYNTRRNMQIQATTGKVAQEAKAMGTSMKHAESLLKWSEQIGGSNVAPGIANPIYTGVRREVGDRAFQNARTQYLTNAEALAVEAAKVLSNGNVTAVKDREEFRKVFDLNASPTERMAAIQKVVGLINDRFKQNEQQYQTVFPGRTLNQFTKDDRAKMDRILTLNPAEDAGGVGWSDIGAAATRVIPAIGAARDAAGALKQRRINKIVKETD